MIKDLIILEETEASRLFFKVFMSVWLVVSEGGEEVKCGGVMAGRGWRGGRLLQRHIHFPPLEARGLSRWRRFTTDTPVCAAASLNASVPERLTRINIGIFSSAQPA